MMRSSANPLELSDIPRLHPRVGHGAGLSAMVPRRGAHVEDSGPGHQW